jgi:hypothetical protein
LDKPINVNIDLGQRDIVYETTIATGLMLMMAASLTAFSQNSGPVAAATAFYKFDRSHSQVFNRENIDARTVAFSRTL